MHVYWRALLGYGFIFWVMLCLNDILNFGMNYRQRTNFDEIYNKPLHPGVSTPIVRSSDGNDVERRKIKFGWSLLMWNTLTLVFSCFACSIIENVIRLARRGYKMFKNQSFQQFVTFPVDKSLTNTSKIPVMIKSCTISPTLRFSDTNLRSQQRIDDENVCLNVAMRRSASSMSHMKEGNLCKTVYDGNLFPGSETELTDWKIQCKKLRDEMMKQQATSLKEHAMLSRKLEAMNKENRDLNKQLAIAQKENRAAKQQLDELLQDKSVLVKRLENATKEFKSNTKSKKFALAKLEEVTGNVENLRQQLEQVSRDKEILEKKLRLLENEYTKLHDRYISTYNQSKSIQSENEPERDENNDNQRVSAMFGVSEDDNSMGLFEQNRLMHDEMQSTVNMLASVSQTEMDMRKIQSKIKQLERNLENFNLCKSVNSPVCIDQETLESDMTISGRENSSDSHNRLDGDSSYSFSESADTDGCPPISRFTYYRTRDGELHLPRSDQFAKLKALANSMEAKAPRRIVSSSLAFKNFLKGLQPTTSLREPESQTSDFDY